MIKNWEMGQKEAKMLGWCLKKAEKRHKVAASRRKKTLIMGNLAMNLTFIHHFAVCLNFSLFFFFILLCNNEKKLRYTSRLKHLSLWSTQLKNQFGNFSGNFFFSTLRRCWQLFLHQFLRDFSKKSWVNFKFFRPKIWFN